MQADDPRFKGYDDFAVVAQTFTGNLTFPETVNRFGQRITDFSYLSEDCFHFSQKGYSRGLYRHLSYFQIPCEVLMEYFRKHMKDYVD